MKSGQDVLKTFYKASTAFGLAIKRMGKGDHVVVHSKLCKNFSVPLKPQLKKGTLDAVISDAGMTREEFLHYDP